MPGPVLDRPSPAHSNLRRWQTRALGAMDNWTGGSFLISAAPGAGKTRPALVHADDLLRSGEVRRVVVVCPTAPLTRQWAAAAAALGVHLVPDADQAQPPRDFHGVSITYARLATDPRRWARGIDERTLLVADEAHHLGEDLTWGDAFTAARTRAARVLLLSGTPFRSDASPIPGVRYDRDGVAVPDIAYTYGEAVQDGVCRPVAFVTYDGTLSWRSGDDVIESSFETVLSAREAGRRYRTAISTELPDGLPRILREAHARLVGLREGEHRDAGGLVVAADGTHARRVAALLREVTGRAPVVVLHTEAKAAERLAAFARSRDPWIVAVNMVSEGVDIPRLRVGVYASAAKTPLVFRQIVGRFVRTIPGRPAEPSWLYLPADPVLRRHAGDVEGELRHVLRREEGEGLLDEPAERRASEPSEAVDFVPLSADVESQMTLFGPPSGTAGAVRPAPAAVAPAGSDAPAMAGYERRALLRDKRHRLVADVCRRERCGHREVNGWLNQKVGVSRVDDATIEQLERSVTLLLRRLGTRG
jgi:superfamily II DNA or RNA helicase